MLPLIRRLLKTDEYQCERFSCKMDVFQSRLWLVLLTLSSSNKICGSKADKSHGVDPKQPGVIRSYSVKVADAISNLVSLGNTELNILYHPDEGGFKGIVHEILNRRYAPFALYSYR